MRRINNIFKYILLIFLFNPIFVNAKTEAVVDITKMDVFAIQQAIKDDLLTYETLVNIYLDRINTYDKDYNTIITINENAIEEAKACDREYEKTKNIPSNLYCIPILVKDNIDVKGLPTTVGTKTLKDNYPNDDAYVIKKLKEKGAIVLAKTNMSEFAFEASRSKSSYGEVKNAYNKNYTSYGSSGGSASSLALSFGALAIGTDTNSSIRVPASSSNLVGLRPTLNLLSSEGVFSYDITRDTVGILTKTVKENALLLAVMEGLDENYYLDKIKDDNISSYKIAVLDQFLYGDNSSSIPNTDDDIIDLVEELLLKMQDKGANIIHIKDFYKTSYRSIANKTLGGWTMCYAYQNNYIKNTNSKYQSFYSLANASGHIFSLWSYYDDCNRDINDINEFENVKSPFREDLENLFKENDIDAVIYPTIKNKVDKIGNDNLTSTSHLISSVLGLPSVSTKLGEIDGLYYGVELLSLKNQEDTLYDIIYNMERINDPYILPKNAKNLYTIPDEVNNLKDYYLENKDTRIPVVINSDKKDNYLKIKEEVKDFLKNYNNYEDKTIATNLLNEYKDNVNIIKSNDKDTIYLVLALILFIIIIITIRKYRKYLKRKKMKRRKYRH